MHRGHPHRGVAGTPYRGDRHDPEQWEELSDVIAAETLSSLKERILALDQGHPFLICDSGVELLASSTRELPPDPDDDFNPEPAGQGVVLDDAGRVISQLRDSNEDEA